ncbi:phage terminase small subunit [Hafnia sp.]|uniref:phage terminase small subunit n=1 Tax=Hafnia sp. TaxID=1873498 RepID=UPI003FA5B293
MITPAQRFRRNLAVQQQLQANEALTPSPDSLHLQLRELENDVSRLRSLVARSERVDMKRDVLLPKWMPTVEQYLKGEKVFNNPPFMYCIIWLFDTGELGKALDWADIAIAQNQTTPENFKSNLPTFVADTMLGWARDQFASGNSIEPYFSRTLKNVAEQWRLHEELKAKWMKFAGVYLLRDDAGKAVSPSGINDPERLKMADAYLAAAQSLHRNSGVKSIRERIDARLRAMTKAQ